MKYDKKAGYQWRHCEICHKYKLCCQHHTGHRRYSEEVIWICVFNGVEEGCHERVHRDTEWAYENGYLVKHNTFYKIAMKEPKQKKCEHTKTIGFNPPKCMYCGQVVSEMKHGTKKAKKEEIPKSQGTKMGYEQRDPRVSQAEKLKRELNIASANIKKFASDKEKYEFWTNKKQEIKSAMKKLQSTYED